MELAAASHLATTLIASHGLDWEFRWDHARRRAGQANFTARRITLSKHLTELCTEEQVRQTVLHEIAHALVGPGHGHDAQWKRMARHIGADPRRVTGPDFPTVPAPWRATCSAGHTHQRFRLPTRDVSCGYCSSSYSPRHALSWVREPGG
ncbi:SprT-like domain-containing protein [Flaviflexus huanghaiensis]|uniref:SprT-like domain-containing protein n=1 Tax=Flaviflexus huanghaiensis TaxID=1111473 RepID=UPI0015F9001E|nr:SprT-like domain-containing protein [Flaviflexus huanghaiensis]